MDDDGIIVAYLLDGNGGGAALNWNGIENWEPSQGLLWVHLDHANQIARQWIEEKSNLDTALIEPLLADESRPRSVMNHDTALIILRGVNLNPGADPEDMVSIRVCLEKSRIISVRKRKLISIDDIRTMIDNHEGPKSSGEFITLLNERLTKRITDVIDGIDDNMDELEENILIENRVVLRTNISELRREVIAIRRFLSPQREALNELHLQTTELLNKNNRTHLREQTDQIIKCIEDLDSIRDKAAVLQEELSSRIAEQTDQRMYALSLVACIFLPLTFITGLLGINVGGIPGATFKWAFIIVCILLGACAFATFIFLKRKHWL